MENNFLEEEYTKHPGGLVRVYKVIDNSPGKDKGKAYYHLSPYEEESAVEARIRDKVKSKTALGGIKLAAKKMDQLGKDYGELFTVKPVSGWINRTRAAELRNKLSKNAKAKSGKIYNKVSTTAASNFDM